MAQMNAFFACILMLLIIFSHEFQSTNARLINSRKLQTVAQNVHINNDPNGEELSSSISPPAPGSIVGGGPAQTVPSPPPGHVDDFRPTAPGHSPGVGHSVHN
ncbi:Precursor of CEP3 [Euphorbia peplus]|nr:Precursor of CEP3 [Euphorbia peplus]